MPNKNLLPSSLARPAQTAKFFKISTMTLQRWRRQSGFPQPLRRGNVILYDTTAITNWLRDSH